jgi:predicted ATPase
MSISKLTISNFKGVNEKTSFDIKKITLFIGPNSSGKSSCLHALAALSQTIKLPSSGRPLVLDDEYAQVHLGRFIEVIHSKSYADDICIGFETNSQPFRTWSKKIEFNNYFSANFTFKCTKRTQDIYLSNAHYTSNNQDLNISLNKTKNTFTSKYNGKTAQIELLFSPSLIPQAYPLKSNEEGFMDAFFFYESSKQATINELKNVLYLGPFRQSPLRRYPTRGSSPTEVGAQGDNAITILANEYVQTKNRPHLNQISDWLHKMGLAKTVEVSRVGKSDLFDVNVTLNDGNILPIADLGYGMSQVLPVLTQCSIAKKKSTLIFEQPELHLNHTAAKLLAKVFTETTTKKDVNIIAETHSKDLFLGILNEIRSGNLKPSDIAIYSVERKSGCSNFKRIEIEIDEQGRPEVFDPWDKNL